MSRLNLALAGVTAAALLAYAPQAFTQGQPQAQAPQAQAPAQARGPWTRLAPFPEPAEEVLGATANGKLYVFAGLAPGWKPIGMVQEYDPAANKWTQKKPMPIASHHLAITTLNDKIYAFGGFVLPESGPGAWVPLDNAWEYDPANDTWKALAPLPSKRGAAAAAAANGKLCVVGGAGVMPGSTENGIHPTRAHDVLARVDEYDPATNTWTQKASMLTARNHHVVQAVGGKIYAIGGRIGAAFISNGSNNIDLVEEYDPATNKWAAPKARMPTPRSAGASGVHNGRIIVAGGEVQDARMLMAFKVVEAYDPASNSWTTLPPMQFPRHGLAAGVIGDRFHTVSGDVQSAGNGGHVHVEYHDALQLTPAATR
jgi:N-acetylneuraminic acid mutarotase